MADLDVGAGRLNAVDEADKRIKTWSHEGRDVAIDTLRSSRDIGQVRLNHSRLNVFSSLAEGDKEDNFKFQVASKGTLRLGLNIDSETRVQVFNARGRVVADSNEDTGRLYERFQRMSEQGGDTFDKGYYYIKVSRSDSKETTPERPYTMQLQMGDTFKNDYEVMEYKAKKAKYGDAVVLDLTTGANPSATTTSAQGAATILTEGGTNLVNILSGALSTLFRT